MFNVGNTPLIEIEGIWAKLECCNPTGSIKDRIAKYIIDESERQGLLKPGMKVVEATSGNTGIALGAYARAKGYDVTIVMPENMTEERKAIMRALGLNLQLCSEAGSFAEAASIRDQLATSAEYFNPDQFSNPFNVECHYRTTAEEVLQQLAELSPGAPIKALVGGTGTGGTLIGMGKRLREIYPSMKIVAVEPTESAVMSGGPAASHGINGIGDGFIPAIASDGQGGLHPLIDEISCISTEQAVEAAKYLAERYGYCVGVSSGANFLAAKQAQSKWGLTVTVFADGFPKYRSMGLGPSLEHHCPYAHEAPELPGLGDGLVSLGCKTEPAAAQSCVTLTDKPQRSDNCSNRNPTT